MKYGILGQLSTESAGFETTAALSAADEVLAEQAFAEAGEIATESESTYGNLVQAMAVAGKLEVQAELGESLLIKPETVSVGIAALAHESMVLAQTALGGTTNKYNVSTEDMLASPVQALEVSVEGIKDTAKKIYEGIKMIFKKIALQIKKLAAKLVVALNGTGKKAEKMLKSFNADKTATATKGKMDEDKATKLLKLEGGKLALGAIAEAKLVENMAAISKANEDVAADLIKLAAQVTSVVGEIDDTNDAKYREAFQATDFNSAKYKQIKNAVAEGTISGYDLTGGTLYPLTNPQKSDLGLDNSVIDASIKFYPLFWKGNKISGVVNYLETPDDADKNDPRAVVGLYMTKNVTFQGLSDEELTNKAKAYKIMPRASIVTKLAVSKGATKKLKSFSDARVKDIDKAMKAIDKVAKVRSGWAVFNRLANTELNRSRMFIAGNYVSSIFAMANNVRAELAISAANINMYEVSE
ncbi:MAG: hypothetical protein Q9M11_02540 [Mariprofundaceae bacterium]|nr:hypothetical protein [Mariprofundaceae bacterium]